MKWNDYIGVHVKRRRKKKMPSSLESCPAIAFARVVWGRKGPMYLPFRLGSFFKGGGTRKWDGVQVLSGQDNRERNMQVACNHLDK
jgi:hypothetical protein